MDRGRGRVRVRVRRPTAKIDAPPASFCRPRRRLHVLDAAQREEEPRERTRGRPGSTPPAASIMMGITKKPAPTAETAMMAQDIQAAPLVLAFAVLVLPCATSPTGCGATSSLLLSNIFIQLFWPLVSCVRVGADLVPCDARVSEGAKARDVAKTTSAALFSYKLLRL